eukprot:5500368-Prorocentrum_lima.AAC.1
MCTSVAHHRQSIRGHGLVQHPLIQYSRMTRNTKGQRPMQTPMSTPTYIQDETVEAMSSRTNM